LVTGASKGIGAATARRLAQDGFDIVLHYNSDRDGAESVAKDVLTSGVQARLVQFDISNRDATREALENDIAEHGAPYGIILNAGVTRDGPFPALEDDDWDSVIHINLDGFYNVIKPLLMPIIQQRKGGRIVALTSIAGIAGNRGQVNYSASKAGIIGAVKSLALELAKRKITVNAVAPGIIETQMTKDLPEDEVKAMIPMRRYGTADDVAATVSFLCSDDASYVTRQVISVNGGML